MRSVHLLSDVNGILLVSFLNILEEVTKSQLSVSEHMSSVSSGAQTVYAPRIHRAHGMCREAFSSRLQISRNCSAAVRD